VNTESTVPNEAPVPEVSSSAGAWHAPSPAAPAPAETSGPAPLPIPAGPPPWSGPAPLPIPAGPPLWSGPAPAGPPPASFVPTPPGGPPTPADAGSVPSPRPRSIWKPVVAAAAGAAILASAGTAGAFSVFDLGGTRTVATTVTRQNTEPVANGPVTSSTATNPDWEKVAAAVKASVVAIDVNTVMGEAQGSGFVLDAAGHLLTNNHVVSGATNGTVHISLADGRLYDATVVGQDTSTDLAVLAIKSPPNDLHPVVLGDSSAVAVGAPVMAVGNPLGLANTVTVGIVSAIDRPVSSTSQETNTNVTTNAIQIDAAVNPGNSGGPLFDFQGRVIGITSSIATLTGSAQSGSIGLGFAIPINLAHQIGTELLSTGKAQHAYLGVSLVDGTATADGATRVGAVVRTLTPGSPADKAGIQVSDVVVAINGVPVSGADSLKAAIRDRAANQQVALTVVRAGATHDATVTLAARPDAP
jgi:putative serine protease PepD